MSTWTSRRARLWVLAAALAGVALPSALPGAALADNAVASLTVTSGKVRIAGPPGYCADRASSRDDGTRAFVRLGRCDALRGGGDEGGAVLTASVLARNLANGEPMAAVLPEIERFFRSTAGRQALSRSGRAGTVEVIATERGGDVLFIRARDRSPMPGASVEAEYWRAVMTVKGRMVSLSVLGLAERPVSAATKRSLLAAFVQRVRRLNGSS
jgi:hypothetical protein